MRVRARAAFLALAKTPRLRVRCAPTLSSRMRRFSALFVLCAWLLASGAHWDIVQGFAWARMVVNYSRTMPLDEAVKLAFNADNLCGVCEFVADNKTRAAADNASAPVAPAAAGDSAAKGKLFLATAPEHLFVYCTVTAPEWPTERFDPLAVARAEPPTEPPRAA
jgi:hypothetical protein